MVIHGSNIAQEHAKNNMLGPMVRCLYYEGKSWVQLPLSASFSFIIINLHAFMRSADWLFMSID